MLQVLVTRLLFYYCLVDGGDPDGTELEVTEGNVIV